MSGTDGAAPSGVGERSWTLRRRLGRAFAALAMVFVLLVVAVATSAILFARAGNEVVNRWQPAISAGNHLFEDLLSQETSVRGYALTKDPSYLEPYRADGRQRADDIARLSDLLDGDAELTQRLSELVAAADAWRDDIAEPAISGTARRDPGGVALAASAAGKQRFDEIRRAANRLSDAVLARTDAARDRRSQFGVIFAVAGILMTVVVVACGVVLRRGLDRWVLAPVIRLAGQTRDVAAGDTHRQIVADGPAELTSLGHDVEAMRRRIAEQLAEAERIRAELEVRGAELARSNEDLQQFAYVASHDLSEPLRKVANFCQLLERQYGDQLDDRAKQYIAFAVDGAKRMQILITDLLALSRVGRNVEFERIDLDKKLDLVLGTLGDRIAEAGGRVERLTPLPTVDGDRALLVSLLQNLLGNALKYRRPDVPPVIRVSAQLDDGVWVVTVADNGIGIEPKYADRIFAVFQRLHVRDAYGGTGIGLALCRKIVEFHGGRIWLDTSADAGRTDDGSAVESAATPESAGATFRFTLPEGDRHAEPRDR